MVLGGSGSFQRTINFGIAALARYIDGWSNYVDRLIDGWKGVLNEPWLYDKGIYALPCFPC